MVVRYDEKTPSGADYFEMFYCDDDGNEKDRDEATMVIITEFRKDGSIMNKTWGYLENNNKQEQEEEENKKKAKL